MRWEFALILRFGWERRRPTIELSFRVETTGLEPDPPREERPVPFVPVVEPTLPDDWWKKPPDRPYLQERMLRGNCDEAVQALVRMGYRTTDARQSVEAAKNTGVTTVEDLIRQALMGNDQEHERRHPYVTE